MALLVGRQGGGGLVEPRAEREGDRRSSGNGRTPEALDVVLADRGASSRAGASPSWLAVNGQWLLSEVVGRLPELGPTQPRLGAVDDPLELVQSGSGVGRPPYIFAL